MCCKVGDWNGAGAHTNYSTKAMRTPKIGLVSGMEGRKKWNEMFTLVGLNCSSSCFLLWKLFRRPLRMRLRSWASATWITFIITIPREGRTMPVVSLDAMRHLASLTFLPEWLIADAGTKRNYLLATKTHQLIFIVHRFNALISPIFLIILSEPLDPIFYSYPSSTACMKINITWMWWFRCLMISNHSKKFCNKSNLY